MKKFAAFMAIVVAVTFSAGLVIGAGAPGKVTIDEIQKAKGPVPFDHKAHAEKRAKNCKECHHKDAAGKEQKCSACHKAKAEGKTVSLKNAYHTTCKDCHKKDASKKAPTKCNGCHVKK
jgi:hypothetical protein